jgi:hypothetical protein
MVNLDAIESGSINIAELKALLDPAWANWTPTLAWGTATPTGITTVARYSRIGRRVFFAIDISSADSKAASSLTITLPVVPTTNADRIACAAIEKAGAAGVTYSNPLAYINADGADNKINFYAFTTGTNGQAIAILVSGVYEAS